MGAWSTPSVKAGQQARSMRAYRDGSTRPPFVPPKNWMDFAACPTNQRTVPSLLIFCSRKKEKKMRVGFLSAAVSWCCFISSVASLLPVLSSALLLLDQMNDQQPASRSQTNVVRRWIPCSTSTARPNEENSASGESEGSTHKKMRGK